MKHVKVGFCSLHGTVISKGFCKRVSKDGKPIKCRTCYYFRSMKNDQNYDFGYFPYRNH